MKPILLALAALLFLNTGVSAEEVIVPTPAWKAFQAGVGTITSSAETPVFKNNKAASANNIGFMYLISAT